MVDFLARGYSGSLGKYERATRPVQHGGGVRDWGSLDEIGSGHPGKFGMGERLPLGRPPLTLERSPAKPGACSARQSVGSLQ